MWYGGKIAFNEGKSLQIYCSNIAMSLLLTVSAVDFYGRNRRSL